MDTLQQLLDSSSWPVLSAFLLGLMTAVSPCPLATNITAIAFIGRDVNNRRRVFYNGLIYTLGRAISYAGLGIVLYLGASRFAVARLFQHWGERLLGPLLIIVGLLMLDAIKLHLPLMDNITRKFEQNKAFGFWQVLLLGMVFALAFCPYSGALYFGMLIPLTIASPDGLMLPVFFAVATGLPVILIAWLLAFAVSEVGTFYNRLKTFELWFRRITAVVFLLVGFYYTLIYFIN
ncbi:MAG: sulfite exporter TauE/SafE family protein [Bacteroidetes bacterium]|nr:sulfite exporter TauE/SafE family protein [Bacteroidota bacterium]